MDEHVSCVAHQDDICLAAAIRELCGSRDSGRLQFIGGERFCDHAHCVDRNNLKLCYRGFMFLTLKRYLFKLALQALTLNINVTLSCLYNFVYQINPCYNIYVSKNNCNRKKLKYYYAIS